MNPNDPVDVVREVIKALNGSSIAIIIIPAEAGEGTPEEEQSQEDLFMEDNPYKDFLQLDYPVRGSAGGGSSSQPALLLE